MRKRRVRARDRRPGDPVHAVAGPARTRRDHDDAGAVLAHRAGVERAPDDQVDAREPVELGAPVGHDVRPTPRGPATSSPSASGRRCRRRRRPGGRARTRASRAPWRTPCRPARRPRRAPPGRRWPPGRTARDATLAGAPRRPSGSGCTRGGGPRPTASSTRCTRCTRAPRRSGPPRSCAEGTDRRSTAAPRRSGRRGRRGSTSAILSGSVNRPTTTTGFDVASLARPDHSSW